MKNIDLYLKNISLKDLDKEGTKKGSLQTSIIWQKNYFFSVLDLSKKCHKCHVDRNMSKLLQLNVTSVLPRLPTTGKNVKQPKRV